MGVDDILDSARADLKAEERQWTQRWEREQGRRKRAEAALEERPTAAELEEATAARDNLEREVARLRGAASPPGAAGDEAAARRRLERENERLCGEAEGAADLARENDGLRADVAARDREVARLRERKKALQDGYRDKVAEVQDMAESLGDVRTAVDAALARQPASTVDAARLARDVADHITSVSRADRLARAAKTPRGLQPKTPRVVSVDERRAPATEASAPATSAKRRRAPDDPARTDRSRSRRDDAAESARRRRGDEGSSRRRRRDGDDSSRARRRREDVRDDREPRAALWPENGAAAERRSHREDKPSSSRRRAEAPAPAPARHSVGAPALDRAALQRGRAPARRENERRRRDDDAAAPAPASSRRRRSDDDDAKRRRRDKAAPAPTPVPSMPISESWDPSQEEPPPPPSPTPAEAPAPASPGMSEPGAFAYTSVVRKKCERAKMPGHFCSECQPFVDTTKGNLEPADVEKLQQHCSRHKAYHAPKDTPDGFWELSFIDSQERRNEDSLDAF